MSGARGVPRGRDRNMPDAELSAFRQKIDALKAEGLVMPLISERLGVSVSTIKHRLVRLKRLEERT